MANPSQSKSSSSEQSPVKHTSGGEMPDTSKIAEVSRRIGADASALAGAGLSNIRPYLAPAAAVAASAAAVTGGIFAWKKYKSRSQAA